jgi:hypothetical protein
VTDIYSQLSEDEWAQIPSTILSDASMPLNLVGNNVTKYSANVSSPFKPDADITVAGISQPLAVLGHHFFDSALLPTFDLYAAGDFFKGSKAGDIKAPATADVGLLNTGAVDWLLLANNGASINLNQTYRVVTAGGNAVPCTSAGETFSVPYAAQYWFYM